MKLEGYCPKCEQEQFEYLGNDKVKCLNCGKEYDIHDLLLDVLIEDE